MNKQTLISGLFLAAITFALGVVYVTEQQILRLGANDPQIELAEDFAAGFNAGADPQSLIKGNIDIGHSLAPFIIIYDLSGKPLATSGYLNQAIPVPPAGVFGYTAVHGQERVTWQPQAGVRVATVINRSKAGFVLAGRSLREVEAREDLLLKQVACAWFAAVLMTIVIFLGLTMTNKKKKWFR